MAFKINMTLSLRSDFPILQQKVNGHPLAYLDNAATTQKPQTVIDALTHFYKNDNANVHRGLHALSLRASKLYDDARKTVADFINANDPSEIIFTRNATEGINLVAQTYGKNHAPRNTEILITAMEHHSNIVPWQILCEQTGATLRVAPMTGAGELDLKAFDSLLTDKTKIVAIAHVSNALGTINPIKKVIDAAHAKGAVVLIDGAQAAAHLEIDVKALDCDFYVFSGHKVYGPTGIGALYAKKELLDGMPPYQTGGDMICEVSFEKTTYAHAPSKFEAGTQNIAGAIGFAAALKYVEGIGLKKIAAHEQTLLAYATEALSKIPGLKIHGTAKEKAALISFTLEGVHPHDLGTVLDRRGVATRAGHLCTMPLMKRLGVESLTRASFGLYNTTEEIDRLVAGVKSAQETFAR
jgi:cysteine desulfurase/selenocysteine lyase